MESHDKTEKLKKVTSLFDQFVGQISEVRSNIDDQSKFSEGYMACLKDILESVDDEDDALLKVIRTKIDMDSRKQILEELTAGLTKLNKAYNDILKEE